MTAKQGDLAGRVAEKAAAGTEVATSNGGSAFGTVATFIGALAPEMAKAAPRHFNADRLARIALTEVRRTPKLLECTQESFGGALMTCAQLGLEPGVAGEAYLLPFRNTQSGKYEVQLVIGYQGMAKLFWNSPRAQSLDAQAVFPEDEFEFEYGLSPKLRHVPALDRPASSQASRYYAVMKTTTGGSAFIVMSRADVERFRQRSKSPNSPAWTKDYDAMARKTCIRQLFKLMPKSTELALAVAHDETIRTDYKHDLAAITPVHAGEIGGRGDDIVVDPETGQVVGSDEPSAEEISAALKNERSEYAGDDPWATDGQ